MKKAQPHLPYSSSAVHRDQWRHGAEGGVVRQVHAEGRERSGSFEDIPGHLRRWIEGPDEEFHDVSYVDGLSERVARPPSNVHSRKRSLSMLPTISAEASGQFTVGDDVTVNRFAMGITGGAFGAMRKMSPRSLQLSPIFGLGINFIDTADPRKTSRRRWCRDYPSEGRDRHPALLASSRRPHTARPIFSIRPRSPPR
jgi:hypothetical protein